MKVTESHIKDLLIIQPKVIEDKRGYFMEAYNAQNFEKSTGLNINFVQDNESYSSYGIVRGIHFQKPPYDQAKLVRVVKGEVLDVVVDLRQDSKTFGQHFSITLTAENKTQLFIPRGFGHGFAILSPNAIFSYKVSQFHAPEFDNGIKWNDSELGIDWQIPKTNVILSTKDENLQSFKQYCENPCF